MKILLIGKGRMSIEFKKLYSNEIVDNFSSKEEFIDYDNLDGAIDFSYPELSISSANYCLKHHIPLVIGTTNLTDKQLQIIKDISKKIPICLDSNFSLGILKLKKCIDSLSSCQFDKIIIREYHHVDKKDSPSGTALSLKKYLNKLFLNSIEIMSFREGNICGMHSIEFINKGESIILTHDAKSRSIFASGAYEALKILKNKNKGFFNFGEIING